MGKNHGYSQADRLATGLFQKIVLDTHLFAWVKLALKRPYQQGLPWRSIGQDIALPKPEAWVPSLIGELRSHMPCSTPPSTPKSKQRNNKKTTLDSTDILPTGDYRDKGRELASSLKGQKHRGTMVLMRTAGAAL